MSKPMVPIEDRLWSRVDKNAPNGCWEWTGPLHESGYGLIGGGGRHGGLIRTHRLTYELRFGPIPDTTPHIDHLCRNRKCCNPYHLEAVTQAENNQRSWDAREKPECPRGHPRPPRQPGRRRQPCRICKQNYDRNRYLAKGKR